MYTEKYYLTHLYELGVTPPWVSSLHLNGILMDNPDGTFTWKGKVILHVGDILIKKDGMITIRRNK